MTTRNDPPVAAETDRASAPENVLWQHAAFCRLGLPVAPGQEAWRREGSDAALRISPGTAGETLPDGPGLRLLLSFLCDSALRAGSPTVALGADAAALAARMGLSEGAAAPLAEQAERMLTARIVVSVDDGPELSVLDARSRPRGGTWPASVKLNARFLASLGENAVALDRGILRALSASAEAMDAHAWTREVLARTGEDGTFTAPWADLMARFGAPGVDAAGFREAFESALRLVFEADLSIELAVDDDGVSVRRARPAAPEPVAAEPPAPVEAPEPPPVPAPPRPQEDRPRDEPRAREEHPRDERPREDRPRDERPREAREERPREDRPREERSREDRPRDERPREERYRDDRPRDDRVRDERRPRRDDQPDQGAVDQINDDMIRLRSHLTGLPQVVWLRRGHGDENILVGVTPGARLDTDRLTILMVEPIIMQVSGGLGQSDFERVSAWVMANRDLIDDFWEGGIASAEEVNRRVRKAPGPSFR
ncbi:replication protein RepA [Muricoccus aerilatus]|uniref:replication protein RepA n=1 Tax=Muricoccus aerilatus TaxID=452982 RepID=UPI000693321A|nr:replication protein RepA [Roseomonas aerilata]